MIVNQAFVRRFFPGRDPLGRRFGSPGPGSIAAAGDEIIGVVSDAKYRSLREPIPPTVYSPVVDGFDSACILYARTSERPEALLGALRQMLRSIDPDLPVIEARTLRAEVDASLWQERLLPGLESAFAGYVPATRADDE